MPGPGGQAPRNPPGGFVPSHQHVSSTDLAMQYERDVRQIDRCLFREKDPRGRRLEKYLAHVRVVEDARSPNRRPPMDSPAAVKKYRFMILTVKLSGRMRMHKARENPDGLIQIGRTWDFDELSEIEIDPEVPTGFTFVMGKHYYWETHSPKERRVWLTTVLEQYMRYTNGRTPQLINCSVDYFHLQRLLPPQQQQQMQQQRPMQQQQQQQQPMQQQPPSSRIKSQPARVPVRSMQSIQTFQSQQLKDGLVPALLFHL